MTNWVSIERVILLILGAVNIGATALLAAAGDTLQGQEKVALVVLVAVIQYVVVQLHSWGDYSPGESGTKPGA